MAERILTGESVTALSNELKVKLGRLWAWLKPCPSCREFSAACSIICKIRYFWVVLRIGSSAAAGKGVLFPRPRDSKRAA